MVKEFYGEIAQTMIGTIREYTKDHWQSDWNGDEVGFDEVNVVGLYTHRNMPISYYVETETGEVLDAWEDLDE